MNKPMCIEWCSLVDAFCWIAFNTMPGSEEKLVTIWGEAQELSALQLRWAIRDGRIRVSGSRARSVEYFWAPLRQTWNLRAAEGHAKETGISLRETLAAGSIDGIDLELSSIWAYDMQFPEYGAGAWEPTDGWLYEDVRMRTADLLAVFPQKGSSNTLARKLSDDWQPHIDDYKTRVEEVRARTGRVPPAVTDKAGELGDRQWATARGLTRVAGAALRFHVIGPQGAGAPKRNLANK